MELFGADFWRRLVGGKALKPFADSHNGADDETFRRTNLACAGPHPNSEDTAWEIVKEYYEAAGVVARDAKDDFERIYFCDGVGFG